MNQEIVNFFKEELLKQKQDILEGANKTLNDGVQQQNAGMPDTVDRSSMETDRNFMLRLMDRERKLLKKVEEALERIEDETFGICEDCGEEIGEKRLKVRPVATLCIECKESRENEEKQTY